jgi:RNA-directed DNA polymerase
LMETLIKELNPKLIGWANYFRISYHSQETFISIGHYVWTLMTNWIKRKHPHGSLKERYNKYLITKTKRTNYKWTWGINRPQGSNEIIRNIAETNITTKRPLLKLDKNPYLLENKTYFEERQQGIIVARFRAEIYKKFNNLCPTCGESLFNGEKVELHHIEPIRRGGKYNLLNIQPLHQMCHQQVTNKSLEDNQKCYNKN